MNQKTACTKCTQEHFVLNKKQTSSIVSGLLLCSFLLFMVGYFLGKRKALEELPLLSKQNLFSNQINYALNRLHETNTAKQLENIVGNSNEEAEKKSLPEIMVATSDSHQKSEKEPLFQAHLINFGSLTDAQQFVNRLQRNGINTSIIKHAGTIPESKESSKTIHWYQVVTDVASHEETKILARAIKQMVKLNDVRIVKVNNGSTSRKINQKQIV